MTKQLMIGALRQGATGNQILEILEVLTNIKETEVQE